MNRRFLTLLILCMTQISLWAQNRETEHWSLYLAYHDATKSIPVNEEVFALFNGNLLKYSTIDDEVRLYSKLDGLNGRNIQFMAYSDQQHCLMLVYDDLLIDLFYPENGEVVNMPQIKQGVSPGVMINHIFAHDNHVILAMSNGLAHIDLDKQEVKGYYALGQSIKSAAIYQDVLYAATQQQLLSCPTHDNPLDIHQWKTLPYGNISQFMVFADQLYATDAQGLKKREKDGSFQLISQEKFTILYPAKKQAVLAHAQKAFLIEAEHPTTLIPIQETPNTWKHLSVAKNGHFWATDHYGLQAYVLKNGKLEQEGTAIGGYGPRRDLCYYMQYVGERLLIAGGRLDPYDRTHYDGTLMTYEDGKWTFFQEEGISEQTSLKYRDMTCLIQDPKDPSHHFATAGGTGLYEFRDFKFVNHWSRHNTPLVSAAEPSPNYVRLDGLQYDEKGNLWLLNNQADTVVRVRKPDGTWKGFFIEAMKNAPTCERTLIDSKGRFWATSRRTVSNHTGGLLCLDYNGTIDNTKDDVATYRTQVTNQDGTSYSFGGVYCLTEDIDGAIWIGTGAGLFVIADPDEWGSQQFRITQIKVPRNDGTNLADYLLNGVAVTAICIDGAGRKWIGTQENGLYLVSHDGTEILAYYHQDNSPLLSNNIYSIAIHHTTGEVMIGTEKGLCSLMGHATSPFESLEDSQLKVYPNPLRPEHHQGVTLTGLTADADIKITTTNGQVVGAGTSLGGTFVWDARGLDGSRVKPGVYYFMVSTADGKKGVTAKVVVI